MTARFLISGAGIATDLGVIHANLGAEQQRPIESCGRGGGHWAAAVKDGARTNAPRGMERPAASGRPGNATGEVIAREMAPAGPDASPQLGLFR